MTTGLSRLKLPAVLRAAGYAAATMVVALLFAGFFGSSVPLFDTFGHFRGHLVAALLVLAFLFVTLRAFMFAALCLCIAGGAFYYVLPFLPLFSTSAEALPVKSPAPATYTLVQMNLRWNASNRADAIRTVGRVSPDIITLEEASPEWTPLLERLKARYPYRFGCSDDQGWTDALILSRRPFATGSKGICAGNRRFAARAIDLNGMRIMVGAQHLRWPWPGGQWRQIDATAGALETLKLGGNPVLIAGDFNATPWSAAVARYAQLSGTQVVKGIGPTWFFQPLTAVVAPFVGLPIDNVLASKGVEILAARRLPATSSDHLPVLVTFTLTPPEKASEPIATATNGRETGNGPNASP